MNQNVSPMEWDKYSSDESLDDNEYDIDSIRIKEAKKEIFLRKFSSLPIMVNYIIILNYIQKDELINIFIECEYDDEKIKKKLETKLRESEFGKTKKVHSKKFIEEIKYKKINELNKMKYFEKDYEEETASDSQNSINEKNNLQNKLFVNQKYLSKSHSDIFRKIIQNDYFFKCSRKNNSQYYNGEIFSKFFSEFCKVYKYQLLIIVPRII